MALWITWQARAGLGNRMTPCPSVTGPDHEPIRWLDAGKPRPERQDETVAVTHPGALGVHAAGTAAALSPHGAAEGLCGCLMPLPGSLRLS